MPQISVILSIIIAMVLKITPIPDVLTAFNPDWILLVILAHTLTTPDRFSIGSAWLIGLITDVLTSKLLGQYAFAYAVCAYIIANIYRQIRHFPMLQQCTVIFVLLLLAKASIFITTSIQGIPRTDWSYWSPAIIGALVWPLIYSVINRIR
jgi:rod shape-determining protein MreD